MARHTKGPEIKTAVREILDRYEIDPTDPDWAWDCHGTLVLCHRSYEIIAAQEKIQFAPPIIVNSTVRDGQYNVALVVTGTLGDRTEWSFGEASDLNYRGSAKMSLYPFAMAEKRGKDRCVAKLVGLTPYCYSEEEADDFKNAKPKEKEAEPQEKSDEDRPETNKLNDWVSKVIAALANAKNVPEITALHERCAAGLVQADQDDPAIAKDIRARFRARQLILEKFV